MSNRYASFLLRWWQHGTNSVLVEVEQIQTGNRLLLGSLDAAFDWVAAHGPVSARATQPASGSRQIAKSVTERIEEGRGTRVCSSRRHMRSRARRCASTRA
jgi:hypothetical protein